MVDEANERNFYFHHIHVALEKRVRARTSKMPHQSDCAERKQQQYDDLCAVSALDESGMSIVNMLNATFAVIFSVLSSMFFQDIIGDVHPFKMRQFTIVVICVNLVIFLALRLYIGSRLGFALYQHSQDGFKIVLGVARSLKTFSLFLVTSFIMQEFLAEFRSSHLSAFEKSLFVWFIFLVIYFVLTIVGKSSQPPPPPPPPPIARKTENDAATSEIARRATTAELGTT